MGRVPFKVQPHVFYAACRIIYQSEQFYFYLFFNHYTIPCAIMASATFMKPAMLAPFT